MYYPVFFCNIIMQLCTWSKWSRFYLLRINIVTCMLLFPRLRFYINISHYIFTVLFWLTIKNNVLWSIASNNKRPTPGDTKWPNQSSVMKFQSQLLIHSCYYTTTICFYCTLYFSYLPTPLDEVFSYYVFRLWFFVAFERFFCPIPCQPNCSCFRLWFCIMFRPRCF